MTFEPGEKIFNIFFPPQAAKLGRIESFEPSCIAGSEPSLPEDSAILWKGYDVRLDGIERVEKGLV